MDWIAVVDWVIGSAPQLILLAQIAAIFLCSLFSRYKEALILTVSAALTLLLEW